MTIYVSGSWDRLSLWLSTVVSGVIPAWTRQCHLKWLLRWADAGSDERKSWGVRTSAMIMSLPCLVGGQSQRAVLMIFNFKTEWESCRHWCAFRGCPTTPAQWDMGWSQCFLHLENSAASGVWPLASYTLEVLSFKLIISSHWHYLFIVLHYLL